MKNKIIYASLGIILYLVSGTLFWGYHPFMLSLFLGLMMITSFFINRDKSSDEIIKNLIILNVPIITLLSITSIITDAYVVGFPYLVLTPLVALANYYLMTSRKKVIPILANVYLIVISIFYFNITTGVNDFPHPSSLIDTLKVVKTK